MERRKFINDLGQATAVICTGVFFAACSKSDDNNSPGPGNPGNGGNGGNARLTANLGSELPSIGSSKINGSVIVVRTAAGDLEGSFVALSLICTHQGCTVGFDSVATGFKCPCHGSEYNITGGVTQGPAPAALTKYKVTITDNILTVT